MIDNYTVITIAVSIIFIALVAVHATATRSVKSARVSRNADDLMFDESEN